MSTYPDRSTHPSGRSHAALLFLSLVFGAVLLWRFGVIGPQGSGLLDPKATPRAVIARGDLAGDEKATIDLFEQASRSVVYITRLAIGRDRFSMDLQAIPEGSGSGFIWDEQGHVVTNFHVIQDTQGAKVTLADNTTYDAIPVGAAPDKDLAVLKINAPKEKLRPIAVGTSKDLKVGQKAFAIGNPFGLDQTLTTGIVSALGREIQSTTRQPIQGVIQTDAAINPGNSGGPLLDSAGLLIGVNTAIFSPSGAYSGIGFAIPVDTVNEVVPELIRHGRVTRPGLGIVPANLSLARSLGVEAGVLILNVKPESAAAAAGLQPTRRDQIGRIRLGDVLVAIDAKPVNTEKDLFKILSKYKVGDRVKLTLLREDETVEVEVTLQEV